MRQITELFLKMFCTIELLACQWQQDKYYTFSYKSFLMVMMLLTQITDAGALRVSSDGGGVSIYVHLIIYFRIAQVPSLFQYWTVK